MLGWPKRAHHLKSNAAKALYFHEAPRKGIFVPKNSDHAHRSATAAPDHREFVDHCVHKALLEQKNPLYKALSSLPNEGWTGYTPRTALELLYPDDSQMFDVENHPVPPLAAPPADVLRRQIEEIDYALRVRMPPSSTPRRWAGFAGSWGDRSSSCTSPIFKGTPADTHSPRSPWRTSF
jgi:hypothetical protein